MEPILKRWYDSLKEGKILGLRCKKCGATEFPPVPVCNVCSSTSMEWVEMSGEGELISFSFSPMGIPPYHDKPTMCGFGKLKEGMLFNTAIINARGRDQAALLEQLSLQKTIPVELVITALDENISYPQFKITEQADKG